MKFDNCYSHNCSDREQTYGKSCLMNVVCGPLSHDSRI